MAKKTQPSQLADAIVKELGAYGEETALMLKAEIKSVMKDTQKLVKAQSPVLTGSYQKGWRDKTDFESKDDLRMTLYNKTDYQLAHLLEKGHRIATGGFVPPKPHIGPAEEKAAELLEGRVKVRIRKG